MTKFTKLTGALALGAMVALAGCAKEVGDDVTADGHSEHDGHDHSGHDHDHDHDHDHGNETVSAPSPELKEVVLTSGAPAEVVSVAQARGAAADGQDNTIEGRLKDFVNGKAAFTVVDGSIKACSDVEGDECKTPWDYCCIAPNKLAENSATVKIVDAAGEIREGTLKGVNSIDNLSTVVVTGKAAKDASGNLTIAAVNVYVK